MSGVLCLALSSCSSIFYQPDRELHYPPERFGYRPRELRFQASDGTELTGWLFPRRAGKPRGTILQFHGNAENMSSHYLIEIWVVDEGFDLITFDYRGYGRSRGEPDQDGVYLDALAAFAKADELRRPSEKFILIGQSLGGAIAMNALGDWPKRDSFDLIVLDSTYMSYDTVARRIMARSWLTWILSPIAPLLVSDAHNSEKALKTNRTRLLVVHDEHDPVVPFDCGKDVFEAASGPKEFWKLDQGHHISVFGQGNEAYRKKFLELVDSIPARAPEKPARR